MLLIEDLSPTVYHDLRNLLIIDKLLQNVQPPQGIEHLHAQLPPTFQR